MDKNWVPVIAGVFVLGGMMFTQNVPVNYNNGALSLVDTPAAIVEVIPTPPFRVLESKKNYLRVERPDSKIELRTGGNITWRTNNIGKMQFGRFAEEHGGFKPGPEQTVAVFPTEEVGTKATEALLFESKVYAPLTLREAVNTYWAKEYGFDPAKVLTAIKRDTGLSESKAMNLFTPEERSKLLAFIKTDSLWTEGKVTVFDSPEDFNLRGW